MSPVEGVPARRAPSGYVAQRIPGEGVAAPWVVVGVNSYGLTMDMHTDAEVVDWPVLGEVVELDVEQLVDSAGTVVGHVAGGAAIPAPAVLRMGAGEVLVVGYAEALDQQQADAIRREFRERAGVRDVVIVDRCSGLAAVPGRLAEGAL